VLETVHGSMEANDGGAALPRVSEPDWASPNHVTVELDAMRVAIFGGAGQARFHSRRCAFHLARRANRRSVVGSQPDRNVKGSPAISRTKNTWLVLHRYWTSACQSCTIKHSCTTSKERRITRCEHEHVLEAVQRRLTSIREKCASG
jgi:hypothetical protein